MAGLDAGAVDAAGAALLGGPAALLDALSGAGSISPDVLCRRYYVAVISLTVTSLSRRDSSSATVSAGDDRTKSVVSGS